VDVLPAGVGLRLRQLFLLLLAPRPSLGCRVPCQSLTGPGGACLPAEEGLGRP